jgi:hypothetical protein
MAIRIREPMLMLGLASAMALATAAPSFGQMQQQGATQQQGLRAAPADETFGQAAPRTQSPARGAAQQGAAQQQQCWIPINDDLGVGYYGACSGPRARPVK